MEILANDPNPVVMPYTTAEGSLIIFVIASRLLATVFQAYSVRSILAFPAAKISNCLRVRLFPSKKITSH